MTNDQSDYDSPSTLMAILVAARRAGDRELERATRRQLEERFGAKISFARDQKQEAAHAQ